MRLSTFTYTFLYSGSLHLHTHSYILALYTFRHIPIFWLSTLTYIFLYSLYSAAGQLQMLTQFNILAPHLHTHSYILPSTLTYTFLYSGSPHLHTHSYILALHNVIHIQIFWALQTYTFLLLCLKYMLIYFTDFSWTTLNANWQQKLDARSLISQRMSWTSSITKHFFGNIHVDINIYLALSDK